MGLTFEDRVKAVSKFGFSERQARVLVTVMLHAGVCVPRQYAPRQSERAMDFSITARGRSQAQ